MTRNALAAKLTPSSREPTQQGQGHNRQSGQQACRWSGCCYCWCWPQTLLNKPPCERTRLTMSALGTPPPHGGTCRSLSGTRQFDPAQTAWSHSQQDWPLTSMSRARRHRLATPPDARGTGSEGASRGRPHGDATRPALHRSMCTARVAAAPGPALASTIS